MTDKFSKEVVQKDVIEIIHLSLRIPTEKILLSSRLFKDLMAESIDLMDIRFELENHFALSISDNEIIESIGKDITQAEIHEKLTVESIITFVNNKLWK